MKTDAQQSTDLAPVLKVECVLCNRPKGTEVRNVVCAPIQATKDQAAPKTVNEAGGEEERDVEHGPATQPPEKSSAVNDGCCANRDQTGEEQSAVRDPA